MNAKLKKAIRLHQAGRLEEARTLYERVLRNDADNVTALHFYGLLRHNQGRSASGIRFIDKALRIDPGYVPARHNLGRIHLESGNFGEAEKHYRLIAESDPVNVQAINNLSIALRAQKKLEEAEEAALLATRLDPRCKESWYHLGRVRQARGNYPAAIGAFIEATEIDPTFSTAQSALCRSVYAMELAVGQNAGELPATTEAYRRWQEADPDNPICQFMLAACMHDSGISRAPDQFVVKMFDEFSEEFDQNLADLDYRVPKLVAGEIERIFGRPSADLVILDAGCGTGLLASELARWSCRLTGVDLSPGMLARARQRGMYDELVADEITRFLSSHVDSYDLVVCADTIIYFGGLEEVLGALGGALRSGGTAIVTFEHLQDALGEYHLGAYGRYAHSRPYIERTAAAAGMAVESVQERVLRREGGRDVNGLVVILTRPNQD